MREGLAFTFAPEHYRESSQESETTGMSAYGKWRSSTRRWGALFTEPGHRRFGARFRRARKNGRQARQESLYSADIESTVLIIEPRGRHNALLNRELNPSPRRETVSTRRNTLSEPSPFTMPCRSA